MPLGLEEPVPGGMERRSEAVGSNRGCGSPAPAAQLHTPPTKPSIFVCSTNRLSGIFLCL